jgi:hypothetical protein
VTPPPPAFLSAAVTHGHPVGALHRLLLAHPNAKVAAHTDELPFLVGDPPQSYSNATKSQSLSMRVADALGCVAAWLNCKPTDSVPVSVQLL